MGKLQHHLFAVSTPGQMGICSNMFQPTVPMTEILWSETFLWQALPNSSGKMNETKNLEIKKRE
jgi:hypothetical protein